MKMIWKLAQRRTKRNKGKDEGIEKAYEYGGDDSRHLEGGRL